MSRVIHRQNAFNAGEISPRLKGRSDLDKFQFGLQMCHNAIVLPQGGVSKRPGFQHIHEAGQNDRPVMLIPFEFSVDQSYVLEFGHQYMRVFADGGIMMQADANTLLLLHFGGDNGSTEIYDSSPMGHTVTASGATQISSEASKFGGTSLILYGGINDYASVPDDACWAFGAGAFTLDMQTFFYSATGIHTLYYQDDTTAGDYIWLFVDHAAGRIVYRVVDGGVLLADAYGTWNPAIDTWYHVSVIRGPITGELNIYIDGVPLVLTKLAGTDAVVVPNHDQELMIGGPGVPLTTVYDLGFGPHVLTSNGGAARSAVQSRFGDGSMYFDGADDYFSAPDDADWDINAAADWTLDLWARFSVHAGTEGLVQQYEDADNNWRLIHIHGTGLEFYIRSGGAEIITLSCAEIADSDWHHIAVIKVGNEYGIYLDGTQMAYLNDASMDTFTGPLNIGRGWHAAAQNYYEGFIDEVRVTQSNPFGAAPDAGMTDTIAVPTGASTPDATTVLYARGDMYEMDGWLDEYRVSNAERETAAFWPPTSEYPGAGGGIIYEETTTFEYPDYMGFRFVQSADVLYLFHSMTEVHTITRIAHDNWDIDEVQWDQPPWQPVNTTATTLTPSAINGNITLTASAPLFSPRYVGAYYYLNDGFCKVTGFVNDTVVNANVRSDLSGIVATTDWHKGCWDLIDGYPSAGTFHEDRLVCVGNRGNPLTVFLSETSQYDNFGEISAPLVDTDPMSVNVWSQKYNALQWVISGKRLFLGGAGAEFWMTGETLDLPITPTSILTRKESNIGSEGITPETIGGDIIFVQRGGEKLRSWNYDVDTDSFTGADMTILAEHLTANNPVTRLEHAMNPHGIVWCSTESGGLIGLTYLKDHKIVAFHEHTVTDGGGGSATVESIAVIPGDYDDELWISVARTIDGATVRYIERLSPHFFYDTLAYATMADSFLSYVGAPALTFTGLDHLEGETVQVLADGVYVGDFVILAGEFTLPAAASVVVAGLEYSMGLVTILPDLQSETGSASNKLKRIVEVCFDLFECGNFEFGRSWTQLLDAGVPSGTLTDESLLREFNGDHSINPWVLIRHNDPTPFTLLALTQEIELEDD